MTNREHHRTDRHAGGVTRVGWILAAAALIAAATTPAAAGADPRAMAMGGAQTAAARGLSAPAWNPANLAFSPGGGLRLAGVVADVHNNSFSLGRYNEVSGQTLSHADKERLLADIPLEGLRLDALVDAGAVGLQIGRFALTTSARAAGRGILDRDVFDLVLFGNEPDQTVDFADTWGEGHAVGRATVSWGQPLWTGPAGRLAVGLNASWLIGFYDVRVLEARGQVSTGWTEISGDAFLAAQTAEDGQGQSVDVGAAWQAPGGWTLGMAVDNAYSRLVWNGTVERHEYRVTAAAINLLHDDLDNAVVDADTTFAVAGYTSSLPRTLRLGAAHESGRLLVAADWVQGFGDRAGASTKPRLNVGLEWRPFGLLVPRAGMSLGGSVGMGVAGGLGLKLGFWQIDLAVAHRGGLRGADTRGVGVGIGTQLVF